MITRCEKSLKDYDIDNRLLLSNVEILRHMSKYFAKTQNNEAFDFIIDAMTAIDNGNCGNIVKMYIKQSTGDNKFRQLNISSVVSKRFVKAIEDKIATDIKKTLEDMIAVVKVDIYYDLVPKYLRDSANAKWLYDTFGEKFMERRKIVKLNNITSPQVCDDIFALARDLHNNYIGWDICYDDGSFNGYFMADNYVMDIKELRKSVTCKFQKIFEHAFEHVVCMMLPAYKRKQFETSVLDWRCDGIYTDAIGSDISLMTVFTKIKSFLTIRAVPFYSSVRIEKNNAGRRTLFLVNKPRKVNTPYVYSYDKIGAKKYKTLPIVNFFIEVYEEMGDNKTKFTQIHIVDFGGWLSGKFGIKAFIARCKELRKNLDKFILSEKNQTILLNKQQLRADGYGRFVVF